MVTAEEDRDGYANRYLLDLQGLNMLDLSQKGFTTLHWISLLLQNRVVTLCGKCAASSCRSLDQGGQKCGKRSCGLF